MAQEPKRAIRKSKVVALGRVVDPSGQPPGSIFLIDRAQGRRIACDALGNFKIDLNPSRRAKLAVERDDAIVSEIEFDPISTGELLIEIPPRPVIHEGRVSVAIKAGRPLLPKEDVIDRLRGLTTRLSINERVVGEVARALDELHDLSNLALTALSGDPVALRQLGAGIQPEIPFDFELGVAMFKPAPSDFGIDACSVAPRSPWAVVMAGVLLDAGGGTEWAGRAVSALLRRAEPAVRVNRALSAFEAAQISDTRLREELAFAAGALARGPSQAPVWEVLREQPGRLGAGSGSQLRLPPLGDDLGGRPTGSRLATLLDPCNLEWLECAATFVTSPPPKTPDPPSVGTVEPTDVPAGQATQIRLFPSPGESFGNTQDPGWTIELGDDAIVPSSWAPNEIVLDAPALSSGCYRLRWIVDRFQGAQFFNQQSASCARFFGERRLIPPILPVPIGQVSFVGEPSVVSFTADKMAGQLNAEGCTAVEIAWSVDRLVCSGSASTWAVEVADDLGVVLFQGVTTEDSISVTSGEDRTYTLTAWNTLGGIASPAAVATLRVERYQRLAAIRKISPQGLVMAGSTVTIEVEISCPADDPAVVLVSSDHPSRCPGLTITIPTGQTKATGQVNAGAATGNVTLSGTVSGVVQNPARTTFVVHEPVFDGLVGAALEQCDGGSVTLRVRGATSVSAVGLSGPGGFVPSTGQLQVMPSDPNDPASGALQVTASFGALTSGTYSLEAQADGMTLAGGQVVCALGNPSVTFSTSMPNIVPVCISTSVTLSATSRRAAELSITRNDGTVVGGPTQGTNPCGLLSVSATVQLTGKATFKAVAKRAGAPTATADITVGETTVMPTTSRATLINTMNSVRIRLPDGSFAEREVTLFVYVVSVKPNATQTTSRLGAITTPAVRSPMRRHNASCLSFGLYELTTLRKSLRSTGSSGVV